MREGKSLFVIVTVGLLAIVFLVNDTAMAQQKNGKRNKAKMENETPFFCKLGALDHTQRERHRALGEQLRAGIKEVKELPNGYAFQLAGESATILSVAEWITFERLCCPFFTFALEIEGEGKPLWLKMTGREGAKAFMQAELGMTEKK
jgi:hypothetical protein